MKKISSYGIFVLLVMLCGMLGACSDFEPKGFPEVPDLQTAYSNSVCLYFDLCIGITY